MTVFDTHCHLGYDAESDADADWRRAREAGVSAILDVGIDLASSRRARARAHRLDGVYFSAGLHPNDATKLDAEWAGLEELCREPDCIAIGETGLDYFRDHTTPQQQACAFERHLRLAVEIDKPVIVHCRDAFADVFAAIARHQGVRGVMHCFSGGIDEARAATALGFAISFAGPLTYKRSEALRAAAVWAPGDAILVETDAPFLPPQSRRGQRNEPALVIETLGRLAELRGLSREAAAALTTGNAQRLFGV